MKTLDLAQRQFTLQEPLELARSESVLMIDEEDEEFILGSVETFEQESARFGASEPFMGFLARRAKEPGATSLEELERRAAAAGGEE
jgi:hypothetical protein